MQSDTKPDATNEQESRVGPIPKPKGSLFDIYYTEPLPPFHEFVEQRLQRMSTRDGGEYDPLTECWHERANKVLKEAIEDYEWRRWVQSSRELIEDIDNGKYVFDRAIGRYVPADPTPGPSSSKNEESEG